MITFYKYSSSEATAVYKGVKRWANKTLSGDWLVVIGHDNQFRVSDLKDTVMSVDGMQVLLIVCNAARIPLNSIVTPAEELANELGCTVWASITKVTVVLKSVGLSVSGGWTKVMPGTDFISMMGKLSLK